MTSIWIDSRKRVAGTDADFEFDIGETVHLQTSARLGVFKIRVADTFLGTDRGTYLTGRRAGRRQGRSLGLPTARGLGDAPDVRTFERHAAGHASGALHVAAAQGAATDGISHGRRQRRRAHGAVADAAAAGTVAAGEAAEDALRLEPDLTAVERQRLLGAAPDREARPQRPEPSFNELRREALARSPEAA